MTHAYGFGITAEAEEYERLSRARRYAIVNTLVLLLLLLAAVALQLPQVEEDGVSICGWRFPETCAYRRRFGRPCLGCGLTRSVLLAARGEWHASLAAHPVGVWLCGYMAGQMATRIVLLAVRPRRLQVPYVDLILSLILFFAAVYVPIAVAFLS